MWERFELKDRAKACLRNYYWPAFLVCVLVGLLGGSVGIASFWGDYSSQNNGSQNHSGGAEGFLSYNEYTVPIVLGLSIGALIILFVVLAFGLLVGNVVTVGKCRFFMESRQWGRSAGVGKIFYGFSSGAYWNVVLAMFLTGLYIFLWSLLLIIPGVIKGYQYAMVPYILSEYPDMDCREAMDRSRNIMEGNKWALFVLQLSFLGWFLLGMLACGIGVLFVEPYYEATVAELYGILREKGAA